MSVPARPSGHLAAVRRAALAAIAAGGLVSVAGVASASPANAIPATLRSVHLFAGRLTDLQPSVPDPLDGARARLLFVEHHGSSTFVLAVSGVGSAGVGHTYGAHLHTGPCVAGDGAAAGPHYNQSTLDGTVPPVVNNRTEVWLDVTIGADGTGVAVATVPFIPVPGNRAVVVHAAGTDDHGTAGARLACLPVSWT